MVFGRYYSRRLQKVLLEADDCVLLLATLFTFALCAIGITFPRIARAGTGVIGDPEKSYAETKLLRASFISWMSLYGASVALSKIAILLLYLRVFTTNLKRFTVATYVIGFVVVATGLATMLGSVLKCIPMARNWDHNVPGRCIDELTFARYTSIPNVVTGFAMLILPLPMVWRLKISVHQKIALTATFLHGIIGFAASVARLAILFEPGMENSSGALAISWTIWTIVEPGNYVIAACLPTLRPILARLLPASFFLLSAKRKSRSYSSLKISWPKGRASPRIMLATAEIHGQSHLTGPWDQSKYFPEDLEAGMAAKAPDKALVHESRLRLTPSPIRNVF
ncbi:MAG: hypothetical protein Q9206_006047 [Seirophora lacunosa]